MGHFHAGRPFHVHRSQLLNAGRLQLITVIFRVTYLIIGSIIHNTLSAAAKTYCLQMPCQFRVVLLEPKLQFVSISIVIIVKLKWQLKLHETMVRNQYRASSYLSTRILKKLLKVGLSVMDHFLNFTSLFCSYHCSRAHAFPAWVIKFLNNIYHLSILCCHECFLASVKPFGQHFRTFKYIWTILMCVKPSSAPKFLSLIAWLDSHSLRYRR